MSIPTPYSWKCTKVVKQYSPKGQTYPHRFEHSQKWKRSALFESFGTANDILPRNCTVLIRSKRSCKQEMQWARSVWFHLRIESDTYQQQASSCNHGNRLQSPNVQHTNPEFLHPNAFGFLINCVDYQLLHCLFQRWCIPLIVMQKTRDTGTMLVTALLHINCFSMVSCTKYRKHDCIDGFHRIGRNGFRQFFCFQSLANFFRIVYTCFHRTTLFWVNVGHKYIITLFGTVVLSFCAFFRDAHL